jgi:putative ABC transport system permease protein
MIWKLLFRNAFRHRLRAALTVFGVAVAVLAFGLLQTLVDAWHAGASAAAANRLVTRSAISLTFSLPIAYMGKVRAVEGVGAVSHMSWFGGIYIDRKNFFPNFAVEPRSFLEVYPEFLVPEGERDAFLKDRKGCLVGRALAERFGWAVGDAVTLKGTIYSGEWPLTVRGIYRGRDRGTDESQFFFHYDYLNERLKERNPRRANQVGVIVIEIRSADQAPEVSAAVDALFRNSLAETLTETERAFQLGFVAMSATILTAIRLVSLVIIVIIMAVVANTMVMSVRERMHEFAVFKTLGYGGGTLAGLILGESLVICAAGGLLGVAATFPALQLLAGYVSVIFPVLDLSTTTLWLDAAAVLTIALTAAAVPIRKVVTVRIADALGRVA